MTERSIWIGYDSRQAAAFAVARYSIRKFDRMIPINGLVLERLRKAGLYYRKEKRVRVDEDHWQRWDVISDAPMSTDFSISRFLVPTLAGRGWALFCDTDTMWRANPNRLFALADPTKAVMCVHHKYTQKEGLKMDGQLQTVYDRKNWSSVMLFNCDHPANRALSVGMVNDLPGRDLHRFCWLKDDEIGELPPEWNYCPGLSPHINGPGPSLVHFTNGLPDVPGYEDQEYADEWRAMEPYAVGALSVGNMY
jgi:hypothetical protein